MPPRLPPLLAADDPPPFETVNETGRAPVLLVCDHASRRVPKALGDLGLPPTAFDRHIAWDIGAAEVARQLAEAFDAPLVMSGYSRLVLDPNRATDNPTAIPAVSDGQHVPANEALPPVERARRIEALFEPYHAAIAAALATFKRRKIVPAVISVHSCTPVFQGFARPWHVGVLWNRDGRLARPLIERLAAISVAGKGIAVGDNQPYSGQGGEGYTVKRHAEAAGLPHVTLEIRQDLIDTRRGARKWAKVVAEALGPLLADPALRRAPSVRGRAG
jgi:predicted N-formylglutamate amidohydrolase